MKKFINFILKDFIKFFAKKKIILSGLILLILTGFFLVYYFYQKTIYQGPALSKPVRLGNLELIVSKSENGSFLSLEVDKDFKRIKKNYLLVQLKVSNFNFQNSGKEILAIKLVDNFGNEYQIDHTAQSYFPEAKDFGRDMTIYPQTIRDGWLIFSGVDEKAKKFQLTFGTELSPEKITFQLKR